MSIFDASFRSMVQLTIRRASLASLIGLVPHYICHYRFSAGLWTDYLAEWIMARTPSSWAVPLLDTMGEWAKPFAMTGALASLGFGVWVAAFVGFWASKSSFLRYRTIPLLLTATLIPLAFKALYAVPDNLSWNLSEFSFWWAAAVAFLFPAFLNLQNTKATATVLPERRQFLAKATEAAIPVVMSSGIAFVAVESFYRNRLFAAKATQPTKLYDFASPIDNFGPTELVDKNLFRPLVTPVDGEVGRRFYYMSKNAVDPTPDPKDWRLQIKLNGRLVRDFSFQELLSLPRREQFTTLRCVSNSLTTNLMGNAHWSGVHLSQLVDARIVSPTVKEAAVIGLDGHSDSFAWRYLFQPEVMLAVGMNGKTLNRDHGFPVRLISPRYYGFKHIKWISEINFVDQPYFGYWPTVHNFTKEPAVHTFSMIDRVIANSSREQLVVGGFSFAGDRGIQKVQIRSDQNDWMDVVLEKPLSPFTWVRWYQNLPFAEKAVIEARAMDGRGQWQATQPTSLMPNGMAGPTRKQWSI
jgi:DMSO/TMAO reductase YedYZ molybdopterin-dependent catalytic subunit